MKRSRAVATVVLLLAPAAAFAFPPFLKVFVTTYSVSKGSALGKAKCATCHVGTSTELNPYGKDIHRAMEKMKASALTPAVLRAVQKLDSDKDGISNIKEIKAGTLPGNRKSK